MQPLPRLAGDLPGIGGRLRAAPEDFVVEELPAYAACGVGDHVFVLIEKRGIDTFEAVRRLARALGVREGDVGVAGLKDRHAVTRQRLSLPPPVTPEAALALRLPDLEIREAVRHGNKLKTGHLAGNRFTLRVRELPLPPAAAAERARAVLARLGRPPGMPNYFGAQRFGARGDNAARGRALLTGGRGVSPRERRLLISALQSELFNQVLARRVAEGLLGRVLLGDVLRKVASGGLFECREPEVDQPRLDAGELAPTGPIFGSKMRGPSAGTPAAARELAVLAAAGLGPESFARAGKLALGTRRPLAVVPGHPEVHAEADAVVVSFELPAGSYATVLMAELLGEGPELPESDGAAEGPDED